MYLPQRRSIEEFKKKVFGLLCAQTGAQTGAQHARDSWQLLTNLRVSSAGVD